MFFILAAYVHAIRNLSISLILIINESISQNNIIESTVWNFNSHWTAVKASKVLVMTLFLCSKQ